MTASTLDMNPSFGDRSVDAPTPVVELRQKLDSLEAVICVVGLGYVGLPLAIAYAKKGFTSVGIDLDSERVQLLNSGVSCVQDISTSDVQKVVSSGKFEAYDSFAQIGASDVIFVCVPTPVTVHKDPDTSFISAATRSIARHLRPGQLIVLKSTTFPNTTEEIVFPILEESAQESKMTIGVDYALAFSPERVDPGNRRYHTENTPIVVGGITSECTEIAALAIGKIVSEVVRVSSPRVAEMSKLLENIFRSVNIALANELARLCDRMGGLSMWEVVEAASSKPFGFMPFYPGPGLGGHCIPIDPYYLSWIARKYDFETSFITLSARVNEEMPFYVAGTVITAIARLPVNLTEAKVLLLGVAFKPNVDDTRHSPALKIFEILRDNGINKISYSDPFVPRLEFPTANGSETLESIELSDTAIQDQDVVVIITDHSQFPYASIAKHATQIVDTRNALKNIPYNSNKVTLLGGG